VIQLIPIQVATVWRVGGWFNNWSPRAGTCIIVDGRLIAVAAFSLN
jgi:hypothetical protein